MADGTRHKLTLPVWQKPYLEKHKIMELLHELGREIIIQQPVDHLMFIKQLLYRAAKNIGVARVVLLSSPKVNCLEVAKQIAQQTEQAVITDDLILCHLNLQSRDQLRPSALVMCLTYLLHTEDAQNHGWILVDCIKTEKEAKKLLNVGIIPTHVLHLIPPFCPPLRELLYCHVHEFWPAYRREIMAIRDAFKSKLIEIFLRQRFIHEVVKECVEVINISQRVRSLNQARVVLLGPRGSGRNTQATLLAQKLQLVHLDFQYLLCQAWGQYNELGDKLRACKDEVCYHSDLLAQLLEQRILQEDCTERGWVLTGFPYTVQDFRYLDTLDTPPNRVIFLECDLNLCKERLVNRRINVFTGSVTDIVKVPEMMNLKRLEVHPKDKNGLVNAEMKFYCENYGALRNYCGGTGQVVNADQPERWVFECILAFITRGSPAAPPRQPCLKDGKLSASTLEGVSDSTLQGTVPVFSCFTKKV